ncbi:serine hydrolase domain-containing protein [Streptomyces mirabilis]|uniref:serine hydrolase domain-containing protein n=1 Tax=Streptomyces mirabilis TaxID=68239 RepID=UPI0027E52954|nr:serine hydrolase domain-containing protein [Streptomyces mirabilis]
MQHPPSFMPGSDGEYSNTNYVLIGMVIKAVTDHSWEHEVRARILRPLRLTHCRTRQLAVPAGSPCP